MKSKNNNKSYAFKGDKRYYKSYKSNKGFATVIGVTLLGLGAMAVFLSALYSLKGLQNSSLTTHQSIQAQSRSWAAVELVRQGLSKATAEQLKSVPTGANITITGKQGVHAQVVSNDTTNKLLTVNVVGCSSEESAVCAAGAGGEYSGATTTVQIVYSYNTTGTNAGSGGQVKDTNYIINVAGNLDLNGGITFKGAPGMTVQMVVDGNISSSSGFTGINDIYATGNVNLTGGGAGANSVLGAQGNINLSGSGLYGTVNSMKNITMSGGTTAKLVRANEDITLSNPSVETAHARGSIYITGGGTQVGEARAMGNITSSGSGAAIKNAHANGSIIVVKGDNSILNAVGGITITQGSFSLINTNGNYRGINGPQVNTLNAIGSIEQTGGSITNSKTKGNHTQDGTNTTYAAVQNTFLEKNWGSLQNGIAGVAINKSQQWNTNVKGVVQPGFKVDIAPVAPITIEPLTPTTIKHRKIDANELKDSANYLFSYVGGAIKVSVKNVNSIPVGTYFLSQQAPYMDYVCKVANPKKAADCFGKIGTGYSDYNTSFSYNNTTKKWTIAGKGMATGVVFFEGDLEISNGEYYNTFLVPGSVTTAGSSKVYSINYAGYNLVCNNNNYPNIYPTQVCDKTKAKYNPIGLGNTAVLSGSYTGEVFKGGNVTLGASNTIYGNIIAGNTINTGGSTILYGYITVGNQGGSTVGNNLGGSTTIDWSNLPTTYDPTEDGGVYVEGPAQGTPSENSVIVKWVRYL